MPLLLQPTKYATTNTPTKQNTKQNIKQNIHPTQSMNQKIQTALNNIHNTSTNTPDTPANHPHQRLLPLSIKSILSPSAQTKSHRRSNYLYRHSSNPPHQKTDTNLLILLHGAGDDHLKFRSFVKTMNLPQTASLSLSASCMNEGFVTLPFGLGYTWFQEMEYEGGGRPLDVDDTKRCRSLNEAVEKFNGLLNALVSPPPTTTTTTTITDNGESETLWLPERIFLFGYSAGACLVMETCLERMKRGQRALGGAVCVAGGIKGRSCLDWKHGVEGRGEGTGKQGSATPVLVLGGENDETFSPWAVEQSIRGYNNYYETVLKEESNDDIMKYRDEKPAYAHVVKGKGHSMVGSPEEVKVMMDFFSKRLVKWMIGMEGWSEVT